MKFAILVLLAFSFSAPAGFANPITPLSPSPQQMPVRLDVPTVWNPQENSFALQIAEGEEECGDSDNDGECDQGGSED